MLADSRNFHCWSYWRLLVKLMGLSAEEQESYVLGRIEDNFSNYSAWHERTTVLQHLNTERPTLSLAELLAADSRDRTSSSSAAEPTGVHCLMLVPVSADLSMLCTQWLFDLAGIVPGWYVLWLLHVSR